jgi:hypothetical protein
MQTRRRFTQTLPLKDRLAAFAKQMRDEAEQMPSCRERDELLQKASRAETASHPDKWANSSGLRSSK